MELTRLEFHRLIRLVRQVVQFLDYFDKDKEDFEKILKKLEWKFDREYNKGMQ